jgi:hypothetical protein
MAELKYVDIFSQHIVDMYEQELKSNALFNSNGDIQIVNGKQIKIPKLSVTGYKDHSRTSMGFNAGSYSNDYEVKVLDHDRDIEFAIDPLDVDETNMIVSIANIQKRFETTQAIPELDCYTFSKIYTEAVRVGATVETTTLTSANIVTDFDTKLVQLEEAGVPLDRIIMYVTPVYKSMLKQAFERSFPNGAGGINRNVHTLDDIKNIITVPSNRFKTAYDFTTGCVAGDSAGQINYIMIDPEAQVSRVKYSYINVFTPGHDSRTADKYVYQNRKFNGTFALDTLMKHGCKINYTANS